MPSTMALIIGVILLLSVSINLWEMKAYNTLFGMGSINDNSPALLASTKSTEPSITLEENRMVPGVSSNNNNNNNNVTSPTGTPTPTPTNPPSSTITKPYTLFDDELVAWRIKRSSFLNNTTTTNTNTDTMPTYNSFFQNGLGTDALNEPNADVEGPILDFAICGFPKCGTTALMRSLAPITTMPPGVDVCTPIDNTVYYAYKTWPQKYGTTHQSTVVVVVNTTDNSTTTTTTMTTPKLLKGNKCPRYMETPDLTDFGSRLPKTRLIVGIRHPVKWFQSFFNQNSFYKNTRDYHAELRPLMIRSCSPEQHKKKKRNNHLYCDSHGCPDGQLGCVARSRFHVALSMMGKTPRHPDEVTLLNSEILQAKRRNNETTPLAQHNLDRRDSLSSRQNNHSSNAMDDPSLTIPNHLLLYESSQPQEEYFWQSLSEFIRINRTDLPTTNNRTWTMGKGLNTNDATRIEKMKEIQKAFDICDAQYDYLRQELMPIAYTLQQWLTLYFIPASKVRDDVTIPNVEKFEEIVEAYQRDPCNRLIRDQTDGEYYVDPKASLLSNQN